MYVAGAAHPLPPLPPHLHAAAAAPSGSSPAQGMLQEPASTTAPLNRQLPEADERFGVSPRGDASCDVYCNDCGRGVMSVLSEAKCANGQGLGGCGKATCSGVVADERGSQRVQLPLAQATHPHRISIPPTTHLNRA